MSTNFYKTKKNFASSFFAVLSIAVALIIATTPRAFYNDANLLTDFIVITIAIANLFFYQLNKINIIMPLLALLYALTAANYNDEVEIKQLRLGYFFNFSVNESIFEIFQNISYIALIILVLLEPIYIIKCFFVKRNIKNNKI